MRLLTLFSDTIDRLGMDELQASAERAVQPYQHGSGTRIGLRSCQAGEQQTAFVSRIGGANRFQEALQ